MNQKFDCSLLAARLFRMPCCVFGRKREGRVCQPQGNENGRIGTYTTNYNSAIPRAVNVQLAAQRINGTLLQPGELFSFSNAVQPRRPENGYVLAPAIGGHEYGGGICQVSSTLYAAMCHALLPAAERRQEMRREPTDRRAGARRISDVDIVDGARNLRLMTRQYMESFLELKEYSRFSKKL